MTSLPGSEPARSLEIFINTLVIAKKAKPTWQSRWFKQKCIFVLLDCFTSFAMTVFWIPVIATRLQLRAKCGRGVADAAIQNTLSLREGKADVAIQMV